MSTKFNVETINNIFTSGNLSSVPFVESKRPENIDELFELLNRQSSSVVNDFIKQWSGITLQEFKQSFLEYDEIDNITFYELKKLFVRNNEYNKNIVHREKVNRINEIRNNYVFDFGYINFYDEYSHELINKIYDLLVNNHIDTTIEDLTYCRYRAYYLYSKEIFDEMEEIFKLNIEKGDTESMVDLAEYLLDKDHNKSKELYNLAIEKGNQNGMFRLAIYYTLNRFNEDPVFCDTESDKLFDKLIELKHYEAMNYLGIFYLKRYNYENANKYFQMMVDIGYIYGNFGIIQIGCSKEKEKELLSEIVEKWETNRCAFRNMIGVFSILAKDNVDTKFLIKHCDRMGFRSNELRFKIQAEEQLLMNKMKLSKKGECPICYDEKDLIPFDCFGHFFCVDCDKNAKKCYICSISRNQLLYLNQNVF